jgi:hypothetical protein
MKRKKSIQLKAAVLLIVFSLNTVIGFACAMGLDMGFNSHHHEGNAIENESIHHDKSHQHNEADIHHHQSNNEKDNCCNDGVMKFQKVDKAIPISSINVAPLVFFTAFLTSFYHIDILSSNRISTIKYFVRSHHPPIPDIRIAIQSFQI